MSTLMELTIVLVVCPAALAAWFDARYPSLRRPSCGARPYTWA